MFAAGQRAAQRYFLGSGQVDRVREFCAVRHWLSKKIAATFGACLQARQLGESTLACPAPRRCARWEGVHAAVKRKFFRGRAKGSNPGRSEGITTFGRAVKGEVPLLARHPLAQPQCLRSVLEQRNRGLVAGRMP